MARRGKGKRGRRVATPAVAALAGLPAGVDLLAAVAGLDLSSLTGFDLPLVLRAVYRLGNHARALLLDVVAEIMRRKDPDGTGTGGWDAVAVHEVRAALTMSRRAANSLNHLVQDLYERLPQVLDAMRDGRLDQPRARVFSSWTGPLSDAHARAVVDALLPIAPRLTTGELIDEIRRVAIELDPAFAQREHDHGVSQRRVLGAIGRDGTGQITAEGLSAEQVAAACDRLDAIGWYLKRAGHPGKLDHLRADVFAGLLTGQFAGLTDEQLLEKLLADMPASPDATPSSTVDSEPPPTSSGPDSDEPSLGQPHDAAEPAGHNSPGDDIPGGDDLTGDGRPSDEPPSSNLPGDSQPGDDLSGGPSAGEADGDDPSGDEPPGEGPPEPDGWPGPSLGPADGGPSGPGGGSATPADRSTVDDSGRRAPADTPSGGEPGRPGPDPPATGGDDHAGRGDHAGGGVRLHRRGLRLWVGLGTIAGRDRPPAELLGWGLLHAELARQVAAAPTAAWWYALVDRHGRPLHVAPVRRRPTQAWWDGKPIDIDGVQVWLQLTTAELAELVAHPPPGWERLVDDIHHRVTHAPSGPPTGDPTDRFPGPGLRRYLAMRDRRCMFPGCRIPSHRCQADHTIDHAHGGPTVESNLASICAGDHALKTNHGWPARQIVPGHLVWTSPMGHEYERRPPRGYERRPPRGPAHARAPMANPSRPQDDWFRELTDEEYEDMFGCKPPPIREGFVDRWWTDTCLRCDGRPDPNARVEPETKPQPDPEPKSTCDPASKKVRVPFEPSTEDDPIPF